MRHPDSTFPRAGIDAEFLSRRRPTSPSFQPMVRDRLDLIGIEITRDDQPTTQGTVASIREVAQQTALHRRDRCLGAVLGAGVRDAGREVPTIRLHRGERRRIHGPLPDRGQPLLTHSIHLRLRKGRLEHGFREQAQSLLESIGQARHRDARALPPGQNAESSADPLKHLRELCAGFAFGSHPRARHQSERRDPHATPRADLHRLGRRGWYSRPGRRDSLHTLRSSRWTACGAPRRGNRTCGSKRSLVAEYDRARSCRRLWLICQHRPVVGAESLFRKRSNLVHGDSAQSVQHPVEPLRIVEMQLEHREQVGAFTRAFERLHQVGLGQRDRALDLDSVRFGESLELLGQRRFQLLRGSAWVSGPPTRAASTSRSAAGTRRSPHPSRSVARAPAACTVVTRVPYRAALSTPPPPRSRRRSKAGCGTP